MLTVIRRLAPFTLLTAMVFLAPAPVTPVAAQDTITREQADTLIKEIRELRRILESLRAPQGRGAQAPDEKVRVDITGVNALGKADAPLTLVEFTDLECPYCRTFHVSTFERIKKEYIDTGKIRFITRDFPLDFHPNARPAAQAVRCAGEQGKFWEMRHHVTLNASALSGAVYEKLARELKLDLPRFTACAGSDSHKEAIDRDMAEGMSAGVTGTPSFVLGKTVPGTTLEGIRIVGAQPYQAFDTRIKSLLAEPK
jgi:protein-disulfide isomerase